MSRRPGVRAVPLPAVRSRLEKARGAQRDVYAPLADLEIDVHDSLAPLEHRFRCRVRSGSRPVELRTTATAVNQLCGLAGIPSGFLDKVPAALALNLVRSMIALSAEVQEKPQLLRIREGRPPVLRAVLPHGYVRVDDTEVLAALQQTLGDDRDVKASNVWIDEDIFAVRVQLGQELNIGGPTHRDPAFVGLDITSSETGIHPLEIRQVVVRVVCANGMTSIAPGQRELQARYTRMDGAAFRQVLNETFHRVFLDGQLMSARLADSRAEMVDSPVEEVERIFSAYRLGSVRGRVGRWVVDEVVRNLTLFGVSRFDIVQAFTAVARGLDHRNRLKFEDAMGEYLLAA